MVNDQDISAPSALPVPITIEVSAGNNGVATRVLPLWLHANHPWRAWPWLDQFETAHDTDSSALENADSH